MKRLTRNVLACAALAGLLAACGERAQTLGAPGKDEAAYSGTGKAFMTAGWKAGDKVSWESQMKARMQSGQNDYARIH